MRPKLGLILFTLSIFVFGVAPTAQAIDPASILSTTVTCGDPPTSWNGEITSADQVDYYSIDLVAGQTLAIDVDAEDLSSLDSLLEVFDGAGNLIGVSDDDSAPGEISFVDPYFEFIADAENTYYFAISASSKSQVGEKDEEALDDGSISGNTGSYMFFLQCSDPSIPPPPVEPVKVGKLLGVAGSDPVSLLDIDPGNGSNSLRFTLDSGQMADIEFDPVSKMLFAAINTGYPGRIVSINPDDGLKGAEFDYEEGGFVALESAGDTLYGVHSYTDDIDFLNPVDRYSLVTIDRETGQFSYIESFRDLQKPISSLAYHSSEKALYGLRGNELVKFDMEPGEIVSVGDPGVGTIVALDFDPDNLLYVATAPDSQGNPGKLFQIDHANLTLVKEAGSLEVATGSVNGLTFVVGEAPPDEEPVKTLCSSTLTSPATASSEIDVPKLSKLRLKKNPLHRAIGLFKFKGKAGERVTLRLEPEVEESVEAEDIYAVSALLEPWLQRRGRGRVFLGIRDAIPNVDYRARKKDLMPFDMCADLPEDGDYYVMVIRPLLRFYKTDYCLTLESDHPDSEAWKTLDVVWPGDDSENDTATTSAEAMTTEVQSDDEVLDEKASDSDNTTSGETIEVAPALTATEPVVVAPDSGAVAPVEEVSSQELKPAEETDDGTGEVAPEEESAAEATDEPAVTGAPVITEETDDGTGEVASEEEPTVEATDEPAVTGVPVISEETDDETGEVAPADTADEASGDDESAAGGSGSAEVVDHVSDGAESSEGDSNVVQVEPTEGSTL